ncbi:MAG TPA: DUF2058 family protein [Wenzhouxiangella sp.]|nr:DUF2058 family protein [Wenzhouxiangella sp.]
MGSLQEALKKAGLVEDRPRSADRRRKSGAGGGRKKKRADRPHGRRNRPGAARSAKRPESDLERAWKARRAAERREKEELKKRRVAEQEERRKRNLKLDEVIRGSTLNRKDAEVPRYFEHMSRIRRVMCTPQQREQLNRGEIGVVNLRGSYLLVSLDTLEKYRRIAPDLVPDLEGRDEPEDDGSHYPPVPDDLIW